MIHLDWIAVQQSSACGNNVSKTQANHVTSNQFAGLWSRPLAVSQNLCVVRQLCLHGCNLIPRLVFFPECHDRIREEKRQDNEEVQPVPYNPRENNGCLNHPGNGSPKVGQKFQECNGIEYGMMASYAEGLNILHHANVGKQKDTVDAETTPLRDPEHYAYDLNLADITEVWRRGSVISSWLLDLAAASLLESPDLAKFEGRVSDSGEGRWTLKAAIDESVPAPVLSAALFERFSSCGEADFADKVLSALRYEFGGHKEKTTGGA